MSAIDGPLRLRGYLIGLGAVVAAALPSIRDAREDAFPLSTYPMFARPLSNPTLYFVERVTEKNRAERLTPEQAAGHEVMQAYRSLKHAVRSGPVATQELCRSIATRLAERQANGKRVRLRIVRARFDPVAYFTEGASPAERSVEARCSARAPR